MNIPETPTFIQSLIIGFLYIFPFAFLVLQKNIRNYLKAKKAMTQWLQPSVIIINSELVTYKDGWIKSYYARVEYQYTIEGNLFSGRTLNLSGNLSQQSNEKSKKEIEALLSKYRVGSKHNAYVNPKKHKEAYLNVNGTNKKEFQKSIFNYSLACLLVWIGLALSIYFTE